jgi:hypothetical protein
MATENRIRTSDEERERLAAILRAAAEKGMLTLEEVDERLATAYAARYRDELWPLLADLPRDGQGLAPPVLDQGARTQRPGMLDRALAMHAASIAALGVALVGIWALAGGGIFWPAWPLAILVFCLLHRAKRRAYRRWWQEHYADHATDAGLPWGPPPWAGRRAHRHSGYRFGGASD